MNSKQEYNKAYYEANREREKKRKLEHYHQNKEKIDREAKKAYMKEYQKTYKKPPKTPEERAEINRKKRERYANDPEYRERAKETARNSQSRKPEVKRSYRLKSDFGITPEEFEKILENQGGGCAICGAKQTNVTTRKEKIEKKLYIDHDHETGKVRGILCHHCNFGLGQFRDDPELLRKAISYLKTNWSSGAT